MNRRELEDMRLDAKKALAFYEGVRTTCGNCTQHHQGTCALHGAIPADFAEQPNDCEEWNFDDVPF